MVKFKEKLKEKVQLKEICGTCGKPVADKPQSNVTRFLFQESRCMCVPPGMPDKKWTQPEPSAPDSGGGARAGSGIGAHDVHAEAQSSAADLEHSVVSNLGERYEVQSLLGQGGMGAVYKVRDKELQKTFAVKVLNRDLVEDNSSIKRFEQEAKAASGLTHPESSRCLRFRHGQAGCALHSDGLS